MHINNPQCFDLTHDHTHTHPYSRQSVRCVSRAPLMRIRLLSKSQQLLHRQGAIGHLRFFAAGQAGHRHDARVRVLEVLFQGARGAGRAVHEHGVVVAADFRACKGNARENQGEVEVGE